MACRRGSTRCVRGTSGPALRRRPFGPAWETAGHVAGSISEIVRFSLPDDYFITYPDKVRALTQADLTKAAQMIVHPDKMIWVVVGDRVSAGQAVGYLSSPDFVTAEADFLQAKSHGRVREPRRTV